MTEEHKTEIRDIERIVRGATVHNQDAEVPFVLVPEGYKVQDLEDLQTRPRRIRQAVRHETVDSFNTYVKARRLAETVIFANEDGRSLRAIIDYHATDDTPSWGSHTANYTAKFSREAQAWLANNGKSLSQVGFAEFLEERIADVAEPAGAWLLEQALNLQVIQKAVIGSVVRLQSGEFQMNWSEENQKGTVVLPEKIALGIPVFHGGVPYKIEARLRFRVNEGKVTFTYKLVEWERTVEHAFAEVVQKVAAYLPDVTIYQGSI